MHVEGSLSPELLFALAAKNNIALPPASTDPAYASPATLRARYERFTSLDDFLAYYYAGMRVLVTEADFEALAAAYLERAHAAAVRHAELSFDPQAHTERGVALATVVAGLDAAAAHARADLGMSVALVPCLLRHLPVADGEATLLAAVEAGYFADGTLAGLGLCSTEKDKPPVLFRGVFATARTAGVRRLTAHAGEEGPAAYVAGALDELGAGRIDHGVRAAEDTAVVERLAREGVLLTVCPLSNVALRSVGTLGELPIRTFLDKGVRFSINSDDPAYFGGYIQENYCAVQETFGPSVGEWEVIARNSIEGSWCEEERKKELVNELEEVLGKWRAKKNRS